MKRTLPMLCIAVVVARAEQIPLTDLSRLEIKNAHGVVTTYREMPALKLTEEVEGGAKQPLAIVRNLAFHNGLIDVEVSGAPSATAGEQARGFIGVAFHTQDGGSRFEVMYIRPINGRAADQLRRNHATQYESIPNWPWDWLRKESPGIYEASADMAPGEWTRIRIRVNGANASLFVGSAPEPRLVVHDLKLGPGTDGYFRNLSISQ